MLKNRLKNAKNVKLFVGAFFTHVEQYLAYNLGKNCVTLSSSPRAHELSLPQQHYFLQYLTVDILVPLTSYIAFVCL